MSLKGNTAGKGTSETGKPHFISLGQVYLRTVNYGQNVNLNAAATMESQVPQNIAECDQSFSPPQRNRTDSDVTAVERRLARNGTHPTPARGEMARRQRPLSLLPTGGR